MKGDVPAPALRLLNALPVHVHRAKEPETRYFAVQKRKAAGVKLADHDGQPKPILIRGVRYDSIAEARLKLKQSTQTLHRMVELGEAEYV